MNITVLEDFPDQDARVSTSGAALSLRGVTRSFGSHHVLRGVDLDVQAGHFVAIVGRSGCGKSTLLRMICGLDTPTSGTVAIDGQIEGWRDTVRLMFQEPRLLPWQRVVANVEVGLPRGTNARDRRYLAEQGLAQVGLAGREKDWPSVLSGGQRQRVALARALASHPRLLALDEPLQHRGEECLERHPSATARHGTYCVRHVGQVDDLALDLGHHRIRLRLCRTVVHPDRPGRRRTGLRPGTGQVTGQRHCNTTRQDNHRRTGTPHGPTTRSHQAPIMRAQPTLRKHAESRLARNVPTFWRSLTAEFLCSRGAAAQTVSRIFLGGGTRWVEREGGAAQASCGQIILAFDISRLRPPDQAPGGRLSLSLSLSRA